MSMLESTDNYLTEDYFLQGTIVTLVLLTHLFLITLCVAQGAGMGIHLGRHS